MLLLIECKNDSFNEKEYIQKVITNLEQIKSATYDITTESWAPGDTSASGIYFRYIKEYNNPIDTTIGASYVSLLQQDTTQMAFCYDGNMRAIAYEDEKTIVIDSFKVRKLPFRPLTPPFFNYAKNILKYALETNDSISINTKDFGDSIFISLTIYEDKQVEFFGKVHYIENSPSNFGETTSKYEFWISKQDNLPYRIRREMSHDISVETCRNVKLNKIRIEDFPASKYFQPDFVIQAYGSVKINKNLDDLIGKKAPTWILKDANSNDIALKSINSKVVMIQFTSVSCGPCRASIPFLNKLIFEFDNNNFDFVAIEAFTKNTNVLKLYQEKNSIQYKFLMSTNEITKKYKIQSVPVFFILDKNRVIRQIIRGYGAEISDKKIREAIKSLI